MNIKRFLVTGAAGFIGSHSVDQLLKLGHQVVGVDNLRTGRWQNLSHARSSANFQFIEADVNDSATMAGLFEQYPWSGVLHLAALVSVPESLEKPELNFHINLGATDQIARLCLQYHCKRLVFASSAAVYGDPTQLPNRESDPTRPLSPYGAAKLASEVMLLGYQASYNLETICFRYFNVYGPRQDPRSPYSGVLSIFTERFQAGLPVKVFGDGEQTRDFISVTDVARCNAWALSNPEVTAGYYNLCTGQAVSINQVLTLYQKNFPLAPPPQYQPPRSGDIRHSCGDPSKLHKSLGLETQIPFTQGLQDLISTG